MLDYWGDDDHTLKEFRTSWKPELQTKTHLHYVTTCDGEPLVYVTGKPLVPKPVDWNNWE